MVPRVPRLEVLARLLFMLEGNMAMFSWPPTYRIRKVDVENCHRQKVTSLSLDFLLIASLLSLGLMVSVGLVLLSGTQGPAGGTEEMEAKEG